MKIEEKQEREGEKAEEYRRMCKVDRSISFSFFN
jgi:hypothetical protein